MKAVIEFENVDVETGEVMRSQATALASMTENGMKLTYVEDVSGDGHKTRCTMLFSDKRLRVTRSGELNSDFVYEHGLTHHTQYATGYGSIPVTLQTKHFLHTAEGIDYEAAVLEEEFSLRLALQYTMEMGNESPMERKMKVHVHNLADEV